MMKWNSVKEDATQMLEIVYFVDDPVHQFERNAVSAWLC